MLSAETPRANCILISLSGLERELKLLLQELWQKAAGRLAGACDQAIVVPSDRTTRIQEAHIIIGHVMCQFVEEELSDGKAG